MDGDNDALSSHGTLIARAPADDPGNFTVIAELGDITKPGLMRNQFDTTPHNRDIDSYILGVLRRDDVTFKLFFNQANPTHDHLTGLQSALIANEICGWKVTSPADDPVQSVWIFSGGVKGMKETAPVDGVQTADCTIRPSGPFLLNGVLVGAELLQ